MSFEIAIIGAGSVGFTREIVKDLMSVKEFRKIELWFTDINSDNLTMSTQLIQREIDFNSIPIKIRSTLDRREAFKDAKYIFNFIREGLLEAFKQDVKVLLNTASTSVSVTRSVTVVSCTVSSASNRCSASVRT